MKRKYEVWSIGDDDYPCEVMAFCAGGAAVQAVEYWDEEHTVLDKPETVVVRDIVSGLETVWTVEAEAEIVYHSYAARTC